MSYSIFITVDGIIHKVYRDVTHRHADAVHKALGTVSESELQHGLDTLNVEDWYDAEGKHLGPDTNGMEMFRGDDYPPELRRGKGMIWYGMVADDDPIYRDAGWRILFGSNIHRPADAPEAAVEPGGAPPAPPGTWPASSRPGDAGGCAAARSRWRCPHCRTEGWSADGAIPPHYRHGGGSCRPSGQRSEREISRRSRAKDKGQS